MEIFPGGMQKNWNFRRGEGGIFCGPILENPEGRGGYMKNPFRGGGGGGGMDIFWNHTFYQRKL